MRRSAVPLMINRRKDFKCRHEARFALAMEDHDTGDIAAAVAIVGCAPYCHKILVKVVFVPLHDQLMGSCDQREVIDVVELKSAQKEKKKTLFRKRRMIEQGMSRGNACKGEVVYLQSNLITK